MFESGWKNPILFKYIVLYRHIHVCACKQAFQRSKARLYDLFYNSVYNTVEKKKGAHLEYSILRKI